MYTLLLDSSDVKLAVGLARDGVLIDSIIYDAWQRQSEYMILEIEKILARNGISPKKVGEIVSTKGPGSYTGVRISLTIAKTWGVANNVSIFLVSSLEILKKGSDLSLCLINARSKRSYVGLYQGDKTILEDQVLTNDEVLALIKEKNPAVCGDAHYIGIDGFSADIFENMLEIKKRTVKVADPIGIKPVYLKD